MSNSTNFKFNVGDVVKVKEDADLESYCIHEDVHGKVGTVISIHYHSDSGKNSYYVRIDGYATFYYKEEFLEPVIVRKPIAFEELKKPDQFKQLCDEMSNLYSHKNADYGDSFGISIKKYGPIAGLTRISDKFNRLENLILHKDQQVVTESIEDTLMDLASYSLMLIMELNELKQ